MNDLEPLFSYARRLQFSTMTEVDRSDLKAGVRLVYRRLGMKIDKRRVSDSGEWEYRYAKDDTAGV